MTLAEFRKLTANLPEDTTILIKGGDEFLPADVFGGFEVVDGVVSPDGEETKAYYGVDEAADEDSEVFGWTATKVVVLDAT